MVNFTNVTFDENWIYADAYDVDFKVSGKIKVHRIEEIFETNCKSENQFQKAAWCLKREVSKRKVKQGGACTIAWG